ncbi:MAG: hypothetical protein AAFN79_06120 [Pseudomonadota bacterium]
MSEPDEAARILRRVAGELSRIEYECLEAQDADSADAMIGLSAEDMKRRQMLDRVTQEVAAIGEFIDVFAKTGDARAALGSIGLTSIRTRLSGEPKPIVDAGEAELF